MSPAPFVKSGALLVLLSTFGLALKGIWARFAYAEGMDVAAVLFYRCALSAPLLVFGGLWLLKKSGAAKMPLSDLGPAVLLGMLFAVGMTCDFQAIAHLGAGVSRVVLFGFPLLVLAFDAVATHKLPRRHHVTGFVIAWPGLAAVASGGAASGTVGAPGFSPGALLWGVSSLVLYALYVWLSGKVTASIGSVRLTMVSQLTTGLIVTALLLVKGAGSPPPAPIAGLGWVIAMVLVSTVVPYFLMMEGIRRLGSSEASLLAMSGPVVTVAAGWLFLGETMTWPQLLGTAAVMGGVAVAMGYGAQPDPGSKERLREAQVQVTETAYSKSVDKSARGLSG